MTNKIDDQTNAKFLAESYNVSSREELVDVYDRWADTYEEHSRIRNSAQPGNVAKVFVNYVKDKDVSVLDIGAGTGMIGEVLKQNGFLNLSALDSSQKMLDIAKTKAIYKEYYKAFLGDALPLDDESFDNIVASGIFTVGHVDATAFTELNRILKRGGQAVFSINVKLLNVPSFKDVIYNNDNLNWTLKKISPEFDMMDNKFSIARAVIVILSKSH